MPSQKITEMSKDTPVEGAQQTATVHPGRSVVAEQPREQLTVEQIAEKIRPRHKNLVESFNHETNIATRYEIKVRLDELVALYNDIFAPQSR